jgi:hypothetical protein
MRTLTAAQLLDAWERGLSEPSYRRVVPLLAAASPDSSIDAVDALSIGERDRRLLLLREWTFGSKLASVVDCSECNEPLEWTVNAGDLFVGPAPETVNGLSLELDGYSIDFRTPNISDLAALAEFNDIAAGRSALIEKCVLAARFNGEDTAVTNLPTGVVNQMVKQMAEADPQADLKFELNCPACGENWLAVFDIESFFWSEISAWAQRILLEVHLLASAYGWRERDILNLSSWRRRYYLGLVSG